MRGIFVSPSTQFQTNSSPINSKYVVGNSDDKDDRTSQKVLAELENIDDDCDKKGIPFVKIDNEEEAKEYGIDEIPTLVYFENQIPSIYSGSLIFL